MRPLLRRKGYLVGAGVFLLVLGAILTFAVRDGVPAVDVHMVGAIFMLAGGGIIAYAQREAKRERVVTRVEDSTDPGKPTHTVQETTVDREIK